MEQIDHSSDEPEILVHLKKLSPSSVYFLAPKEFFLEGFEEYRRGTLQQFTWHLEKRLLKGSLFGMRRCAVALSMKKGTLHYSCNCPNWNSVRHCRHVICTLLTIFNLLNPKLFQIADQIPARRELLKATLLGTGGIQTKTEAKSLQKKAAPEYELVVDIKQDYPSIYIRKDGMSIDSPSEVPAGLSPFIFHYFTDDSLQNRFYGYLCRHGNKYPIFIETETEKIEVSWEPLLKYRGRTELNISGDQMEVHALSLREKAVCEKGHRFWNFVADFETGTLGQVSETAGWAVYNFIDDLFRTPEAGFDDSDNVDDEESPQMDREWIVRNRHFRIPLSFYQSLQFNIPIENLKETLERLVLKVEGAVVSPVQSKHAYRLTIDPGEGGLSTLRAECWLGSSSGMTTATAFSFFSAIKDRALPMPLRAQKRQALFCRTFLRILSLKSKIAVSRAIRESLSNGDFTSYALKQVARELLKKYYAAFSRVDVRLRVSQAGWFIVSNDKQIEASLYQIPFELFGQKIFKEMPHYHEMSLPTKTLYEQLPRLHENLKTAGIDLYYDGKPITTAKWDFSFDARREKGIDWFEIRPEIKCDGAEIDKEVWQNLIRRNGMVEKEGLIQIVDIKTQKILESLSLIVKKSESGKNERKEIVQVPKLQILDWILLRRQGVRVRLSEEDEALMNRLTRFDKVEKIRVPRNLKATLRAYQKEGLDWLAFLYGARLGACLADDMGLGKTIQAISLLAVLKENILETTVQNINTPHLIVVPPSLLFNWEHEIKTFYPELKVYSYTGKDRKTDFNGFDVVLTTYALARIDIQKLKEILFHVVIFDEAQAVKNIYANTTGAVRQIRSVFKLVMTGTPLENHLGEYYSLIDLSLPGLLGEYDDFISQVKSEDDPMRQVLISRTRPFVLRRIKETILDDLPPKTETDIYLDLTPYQKRLYQQTVAMIKTRIDDAYRNKTGSQARIIALTAIMKLRQLCVSPLLVIPADSNAGSTLSPKILFLIDQLHELLSEGHSALIFSQFTKGLDLLEKDLGRNGISFSRLDGSTPTKKRKELVKKFQGEEIPAIFLLSLKAGGQGLNLTKASYVFHLDPWWNPAVEDQASDRTHRIGQKNKVTITRILMRHTIEEKMMLLKKKKLALYDAVMGGDEGKTGKAYAISKSDFDFLLQK
ncbi:MAG: DEAD/DEAH box helicase [Nitrospiria bacterium]